VARFVVVVWLGVGLCGVGVAQSWQRMGPEGGLVVSLGMSPRGGIYLGTADGHVFFSGDRARSWELRGRVGPRVDAVVTRLLADPNVASRVYAAVWYRAAGVGGGVFRSEDGGRSWSLIGLGNEAVRALEQAPLALDTLVAGTLTGVFRSRDAGKNWERISPAGDQELRNIDSLAIDPRNPDLIYAGTYHLPWKTEDGGKSWKPVTEGMIDDSDVMSLRIDATNPMRLFLSACSGIYRSENQGTQWVKLQGIPYSARRTQQIVQDISSPKTLYAATTEGLWMTRDDGESWARTTPKEWVVNSVVVLGGNGGAPKRVVLGTDGLGVQVSEDEGVHFQEANRGLTHVIANQIAADVKVEGHFLIVAELYGEKILETRDGGKSWSSISWPEVARERAGRSSEESGGTALQVRQIYASPWGWMAQLGDGQFVMREDGPDRWKEWKLREVVARPKGEKAAGKPLSRGVRLQPDAQVAFAENAAYVSTAEGVRRCLASGVCTAPKAFEHAGEVHALWASADGRKLAVVRGGKLGFSSNAGETAVSRDLPAPDAQALWLDVAESGADEEFFLGTTKGLFATETGSASWKQLRAGLPDAPVMHWLRRPEFWALTERDGGMYVSRDHGASWSRVDDDAERGRFTGLVAAGANAVMLSSQSEGVLKFALSSEQGESRK
jgi:photosystem II stability/assembly factor-like uncharacterized protein